MSDYQALSRLERMLPLVLIANVLPFLFGLLGIALTLEYQSADLRHWAAESYLSFVFASYLPVALVIAFAVQRREESFERRQFASSALVSWGMVNLLTCATILVRNWSAL